MRDEPSSERSLFNDTWRVLYLAGLALFALTACGTTSPSSTAALTPATHSAVPSATATTAGRNSPSPATAPTAASTDGPTAGSWQPIPEQDALVDNQVLDVTWTGTRFVALGWDRFLDSADGLTWHSQEQGGKNVQFRAIASGPRGVVAVGTLGGEAATWWSADGLAWTAHRDAFPARPGRGNWITVRDLVATDEGWLAVGREDPFCQVACPADPVRALVWRSSDGLRWTRVPDHESLKGGAMNAVARADQGYVAAGAIGGRAAIWTSPDGATWSRIRDISMFDPLPGKHASEQDTEAVGVAVRDGVYVAVGGDFGAQDVGFGNAVRAWRSADGRSWSEARVDLSNDGQAVGVASTPTGFLAIGPGGGPPDGTSCNGGIWASADGRAWACSALGPEFDGFGPSAAAASSTLEIALGFADPGLNADDEVEPRGAGWWRSVP